jgi:hypothetical protein
MGGGMGGGNQYGAAAASYGGSGPVPNGAGGVTYTLYVPDAVVPAILGRGGVVIKELMQQSGVCVSVCVFVDSCIFVYIFTYVHDTKIHTRINIDARPCCLTRTMRVGAVDGECVNTHTTHTQIYTPLRQYASTRRQQAGEA